MYNGEYTCEDCVYWSKKVKTNYYGMFDCNAHYGQQQYRCIKTGLIITKNGVPVIGNVCKSFFKMSFEAKMRKAVLRESK